MALRRINATKLLQYTTGQLWDMLTGKFILVFSDGEIETNDKMTLYSSYAWNFHRQFPNTPLLKMHHVQDLLGDTRLGSNTHLDLLRNAMWSVYDHYMQTGQYEKLGFKEIDFRDRLAKMIYQINNQMYNDLIIRLEAYVTSLDIVDFMEVLNHPRIKAANDTVEPTAESIEATYAIISDTLLDGVSLPDNVLSKAARSQLVKINQLLQCVGPRGFLTDIDSSQFPHPIMRGYAMGIRSLHDSMIESRSAAKALTFSEAPLQQTEYFSRRLQLLGQSVQNLHPGDCGTTEYLLWTVRGSETRNGKRMPGDLKLLEGKYYLGDDGKLKMVRTTDRQLVGKTIKMRSVLHCGHLDPYGVCSTCFGELHLSVPARTNIGQMCCTHLAQQSSQSVLSTKHLDSSASIEGIQLDQETRKWLRVSVDQNSYLLAESLKGKGVKLLIASSQAPNFSDVKEVDNVRKLNSAHISQLEDISLEVTTTSSKGVQLVEQIGLNVSVHRRMAFLTYDLLEYAQKNGWIIDNDGNYTIDMKDWNWNKNLLTLPMIHFNMSDHSKDIATLLESSVDQLYERDQNMDPDAILGQLYDLVNEKLSVNCAVLEVVLLSTMVISADKGNYAMPKPWTTRGLGVMRMTMANRSASIAMAYEKHADFINSPVSFINRHRPDHPMDMILMPGEVSSSGG